jgi:ubiquinone/menaquinone biosynthesis C-methylase UbiE
MLPTINQLADQSLRSVSQQDVDKEVAHRLARIWRQLSVNETQSAPSRDTQFVSDVYEAAYAEDNEAYALSRTNRRDIFRVNNRYVCTDGWFIVKSYNELLFNTISALPVRSVLEVGSGRGVNLALLGMRQPGLRMTGLELTRAGVTHSIELVNNPPRALLQLLGIKKLSSKQTRTLQATQFVQHSATNMPFPDNSFDISFTCLVLEQIPHDYPAVLREMCRVTRRYCLFIEPFQEANNPLGLALLQSSDYFRTSYKSFADHGLKPVRFSTSFPQKVHFGTGMLLAKVI